MVKVRLAGWWARDAWARFAACRHQIHRQEDASRAVVAADTADKTTDWQDHTSCRARRAGRKCRAGWMGIVLIIRMLLLLLLLLL